jgi:hypothetical protein
MRIIEVIKHERYRWSSAVNAYPHYTHQPFRPGDCFYLSHPSSIDGNIWPHADAFIEAMAKNHPQVSIRLDLCYLGTTTKDFVLNNANLFNVEMIFFSLSKVFGVYYHRIGGVFSKKAFPGLYGNKWFKNLFSLKLGTALMEEFSPKDLPRKYAHLQEEAVVELRENTGEHPTAASDVVLLAWASRPVSRPNKAWEDCFIRGNHIRYCLTPYMGRKLAVPQ